MIVGTISEKVKNLLNLSIIDDNNIYIGNSNIKHMQTRHSSDYKKYGNQIQNILKYPDFVGLNPKDNSIEYVKNFLIDNEYVKVAVRILLNGKYYARSLYVLNKKRTENFIKKGTLKKLDIST